MTRRVQSCLGVLALLLAGPAWLEAGASGLVDRAREQVEAGTVVPERDIAPLVAELMKTGSSGAADTLITAIVELGAGYGTSPAAVKDYLRREAPRALLRVAAGKFDSVVRGSALTALRSLDADEAALKEAIGIAQADRSKDSRFIHDQGALLQNWLDSRRRSGVSVAARLQPKDPAREQRALVLLRQHGIGANANALTSAAIDGQADVVQALLDAGVPADGRGAIIAPLSSATAAGCAAGGGHVEDRVAIVEALVKAGADPKAADPLGNTILLECAHLCPLPVVKKLVELGAPANPRPNAQGATPLGMALISGKWDVAEFLVDSGARITAKEVDMVFFEKPTDPKQLALLKRAQQGAGK